jgi:hypothetical protein
VVRPERLDFGTVAAGATKQLPLRLSNAGGRTLFGEITSNRAWLSVNRRTFISSAALVFVSVDTAGLRAGEDYTGSLVVTTLNGGDQVVPVAVRVAGRPQPILAGAPSLLDFGPAQPGSRKARTVKLTNAGTGTLIGSVAVRGDWLAVSESSFRGTTVSFEVIANTAGLAPGEHRGEVLVFSNGGEARIEVLVEVAAPAAGEAIVTAGAAGRAPDEAAGAAGSGGEDADSRAGATGPGAEPPPAELSREAQRELIRRVTAIEPETTWERDFLRRIVQLIRAGERLAPGELAKIYELEARPSQ